MNKLILVTALALLSYGSAFADGGASADLGREHVVASAASTGLSRAAVLAELDRARASGELAALNSDVDTRPISTVSTKTRAQVLAELQSARDSGELALLNSDNADFASLSRAVYRAPEVLAGQPARAQ